MKKVGQLQNQRNIMERLVHNIKLCMCRTLNSYTVVNSNSKNCTINYHCSCAKVKLATSFLLLIYEYNN